MKKSLEDLCLLAIAGAGILCLIALLVAVLQVPTTGVVTSSSAPPSGSVAVNFVENHHNAVIASGIFLLVLVPVGAKFLPRLSRRRRGLRAEAVPVAGVRMSPYSVQNDSILKDSSDSILKPEYRSAYGKVRESSSSLVGSRKAS